MIKLEINEADLISRGDGPVEVAISSQRLEGAVPDANGRALRRPSHDLHLCWRSLTQVNDKKLSPLLIANRPTLIVMQDGIVFETSGSGPWPHHSPTIEHTVIVIRISTKMKLG